MKEAGISVYIALLGVWHALWLIYIFLLYSKTHSVLSRIELALGSEEVLHLVKNMKYMPRGLSDHSPLVVSMSRGEWKISPHWLEIIGEEEGVISSLVECMSINAGRVPLGVVWDALKASLRGMLIQRVARVKTQTREQEKLIMNKVTEVERQYIVRLPPEALLDWVKAQQEYKDVLLAKAENTLMFDRQRYYVEGESAGNLLARLVGANTSTTVIPAIRTDGGWDNDMSWKL